MTCPSALDYSNAIQNPQLNFRDSALKAGQPECTALGLPRPISGNFATVFQLHCPNRDWAVRCFTRELNHQQARYAVIQHHLEGVNLPYMVPFEFLPKGIRIYGRWYPILKMQWLEGQLLHHFLTQYLQQSERMRQLARRWLELIQALEQANIAHGDLQHGNILLVNDEIKLVDYDNLFVPALAGQLSRELGHNHYQHPARNQHDFGGHMDRFSAWLILISIMVVILDPSLWAASAAGDDALLLRQEDMLHPQSSETFALLRYHHQIVLRLYAEILEKLLTLPLAQIPALTPLIPTLATLIETQTPDITPIRQQLLAQLNAQQTSSVLPQLTTSIVASTPITPSLPSRLPYPPVSSQAEAQWFQEAAYQGYADAQYTLGWMYTQGEGLAQDFIQARYWFAKAAHQGHRQAQYQLGCLYLEGQGVVADPLKASHWYVQAALQGHEQARKAQIQLALKAAQQGHREAQYILGLMYAQSATDGFQAAQWWQKAAQQGHKQAQYALAQCYEQGEGVVADSTQALYWYAQAAQQGHLAAIGAYVYQIYYSHRFYLKTFGFTAVSTFIGLNLLVIVWFWQAYLFTWSRWLTLSGWLTLISLILAWLIAEYRESSS